MSYIQTKKSYKNNIRKLKKCLEKLNSIKIYKNSEELNTAKIIGSQINIDIIFDC